MFTRAEEIEKRILTPPVEKKTSLVRDGKTKMRAARATEDTKREKERERERQRERERETFKGWGKKEFRAERESQRERARVGTAGYGRPQNYKRLQFKDSAKLRAHVRIHLATSCACSPGR